MSGVIFGSFRLLCISKGVNMYKLHSFIHWDYHRLFTRLSQIEIAILSIFVSPECKLAGFME